MDFNVYFKGDNMSEILQKDLLEYAYDKQKHEKLNMFKLGDILEDFREYSKDDRITSYNVCYTKLLRITKK